MVARPALDICHCPEPYYNEDTGPIEKETDKQVMVVPDRNSSTQEVEEGECKFEDRVGYIWKPCLNNQRTGKK